MKNGHYTMVRVFVILSVLRDDFGFPVLGAAFHVVAGRSQRHGAKDANARSSLQLLATQVAL